MAYPWHDGAFNVVHDVRPGLGGLWGPVGQKVPQVAGFHLRKDPSFADGLQVVGYVVDHLSALLTKFCGIHDDAIDGGRWRW